MEQNFRLVPHFIIHCYAQLKQASCLDICSLLLAHSIPRMHRDADVILHVGSMLQHFETL